MLYICKILTRIAVFWIFERNIWNIGNAIKFFIIEICIIICLKYDLNDLNDERKNSDRVWGRQRLIKGRKKSRVKEETK